MFALSKIARSIGIVSIWTIKLTEMEAENVFNEAKDKVYDDMYMIVRDLKGRKMYLSLWNQGKKEGRPI